MVFAEPLMQQILAEVETKQWQGRMSSGHPEKES